MQNATKVGLLVVLFGALLVAAFAVLGRTVFAPRTDRYYAELEDAAGLSEGVDIECGYLVVPADRGDPASGTLQLAVAI
ncbi:MAG: hypothetical protein WHU10_11885, partial [Fimbriimonadales bacterium]